MHGSEATPEAVLAGEARWCVVRGDCRDGMASLADGAIDCILSDPPYDDRTSKNARSERWVNGERLGRAETVDAGRYIPFNGIDPSWVGPEFVRVAKRWAIAFCALEQLGAYRDAVGESQYIRSGVWRRRGGAPQFTGDRPAQAAEGVAIMHRKGRKRWSGGGGFAFWDFARCATGVQPMATERVHPTQKPLDLMLALVSLFTEVDDVVMDPFCGGGTTGVACVRLGRRFIGYELEEQWASAARERLAAEERGLSLAAARAEQGSIFDLIGKVPA